VTAAVEDGRVTLIGGGSVTAMQLTAGPSNPLVKEMGFAASQAAVDSSGTFKIRSQSAPAFLVGRLSSDATFQVNLDGEGPVAVTVTAADTAANRSVIDLVRDVQEAIDEALGIDDPAERRIHVASLGKRLVLSTLDDSASLSVTASGTAVSELGLAASQSGSGADLQITTRNGVVHQISLDGATTLGDVRSMIAAQTGGAVTVGYSDESSRLKLTDNTSGSSNFKVVNALGSHAKIDSADLDGDGNTTEILIGPNRAALDLGILGENDPADDTTNSIPDNEIEGAQLGGVDPLDRIFVRDTQAAASVQISTPEQGAGDGDADTDDGLNAALRFGFVGVEGHGGGTITGTVSVGLKPADAEDYTAGAKITLRDLIDNIDSLGDFIAGPTITGSGQFDLAVALAPAMPFINTGASPTLSIVVHDLAGLIEGDPEAFEIQTQGFEDLLHFDDIGFADIVAALQALAEFLSQFEEFEFLNQDIPLINVSVNDLIGFADEFAAALDEVQSNPAGTVQFLEEKLKQAFGMPATSNLL
jgi:hypothetical protein